MQPHLIINKTKIYLNFEEQTSPQGRPFRLSGIRKNEDMPEKWIDKELSNHWIYTFRFLDAIDGFISFEFDYNGNYLERL